MSNLKQLLSKIPTQFHQQNTYLVKNPPSETLPREGVRVLTYNICLVPWVFEVLYPAPYQKERMEDFVLNHLNDYDVMCFQECIGLLNEVKDQFISCCQKAGFFFIAQPKTPKLFSQYVCECGILILSRFQIEYSEFVPYSYAIDGEGQSELGVIYAKIKLGKKQGQTLHIFNTHLQSSTNIESPQSLQESVKCRTSQLREMSNFIHAKTSKYASDPDHAILICGDFNINALPESEETKEQILTKHSSNHEYIQYSEQEYFKMIEIFERGQSGSIKDFAIEEFGKHQKTFLYILLDKLKNKEFENLELNQCFDYILEKSDGSQKEKTIRIKKGSMRIEKFEAHHEKPYQAVSDHCGISVEIEFNDYQRQKSSSSMTTQYTI